MIPIKDKFNITKYVFLSSWILFSIEISQSQYFN